MEIEKALLSCVIKKNNDNTYTFIGSDETIDRDGEVIKVDGWQLANYKKNPVIMYAHDHWSPPVGKSLRTYKEDGKLKFKVQFASEGVYPLADTVRGLVDDGILKGVSVGYRAIAREYPSDEENGKTKKEKPRVVTTKAELYELSIVNVGANPAALREAMQSKGYDEKAIKLATELPKEGEPIPGPDGSFLVPEKYQDELKRLADGTTRPDIKIITDTKESDLLQEIKTTLDNLCEKIDGLEKKIDIEELIKSNKITINLDGKNLYSDLLAGTEKVEQPPKKKQIPFKETAVKKQTIFGGKKDAT